METLLERKIDHVAIGRRIKSLRLNKGMMQSELAKILDMSQTHMSNIERGQVGLTLDILVMIANLFGCSLDYVIFGTAYKEEGTTEWMRKYTMEDCYRALEMLESLHR